MKQLLAGVIFFVIALIAFSQAAPNVGARPLEYAIRDLVAGVHLR